MTRIKFLLIAISLVMVDQLSKYIVRHSGGFYVCNSGIAFGINVPYAFIITIAIIIAAVIFLRKNESRIRNYELSESRKFQILNSKFIILIAAGALSNLIDRLLYGCITDFIDIKIFHYPFFNLADVFITIGGIMILSRILKREARIVRHRT